MLQLTSQGKIYYDPETIEVETGTTVVWTNVDSVAHTVTSTNPDAESPEYFDSGLMAQGAVYERTFAEQGNFEYFCILHPWMVGTVVVN